jgi:hypothetical protein
LAGVHTIKLAAIPAAGRPTSVAFVGEGQPGPHVAMTSSATILGPVRKALIFSSLSAELETASGETAAKIIAEALDISVTSQLDAELFSANAPGANNPGGILHGLVPLTSGGGVGAVGIADDLAKLAATISAAGINPDTVMFFTSAINAFKIKVLSGPKLNNEVIISSRIADDEVVAVVPEAFYTGYGDDEAVQVEVSREALLHYEDANPLPIASPGSPPTVAAPTLSLYQQNFLGLKVRARCTWSLHAGGAASMTGVNW